MGLDMYLEHRLTYRGLPPDFFNSLSSIFDKSLNDVSWELIGNKSIAYWRKANQIHLWFVTNVQGGKDDCGEYEVQITDLEDLVDVCQKVLDDRSLARTLLPTNSGFFFGSTDYDEDYFWQLKETIEMLAPFIKSYRSPPELPNSLFGNLDQSLITYQSSW